MTRSAVQVINHSHCSGCSLCVLVCPAWRATRDLGMSPEGRAKALQHGASLRDIASSVEACTLCGACEPVCPENIPLVDMVLDLRRELRQPSTPTSIASNRPGPAAKRAVSPPAILIPDAALRAQPALLSRAAALLQAGIVEDDGGDISLALEMGEPVATLRLEEFLAPLRSTKQLVVADGLLLRHLRQWLRKSKIASLGEALSGHRDVRDRLRDSDLYVIEARAYHADHARLVKYYDTLFRQRGCASNLDLQRIAIPATGRTLAQRMEQSPHDDSAQVQWIMKGRSVSRVVVESVSDLAAFRAHSSVPSVHIAELDASK
jgi:ferredoxin